MKDYSKLGLSRGLKKTGSLADKPRKWQSDFEQDAQVEKGPYSNPTEVQKGTTDITKGGIINFKDASGSTILTYSPATGEIAITSDVSITGDLTVSGDQAIGTLSSSVGTLGTVTLTQGTVTGVFAVQDEFTVKEILMETNTGNKIREDFGLCLSLADKVGGNSVRVQNSDLTDLLQIQSKGGIRFLEQSTPSNPDKGLLFFDTADGKFKFFNGGDWETITSSA